MLCPVPPQQPQPPLLLQDRLAVDSGNVKIMPDTVDTSDVNSVPLQLLRLPWMGNKKPLQAGAFCCNYLIQLQIGGGGGN